MPKSSGSDPQSSLSDGSFVDDIAVRARYYGAAMGARVGEPDQSDRLLRLGGDMAALFGPAQAAAHLNFP